MCGKLLAFVCSVFTPRVVWTSLRVGKLKHKEKMVKMTLSSQQEWPVVTRRGRYSRAWLDECHERLKKQGQCRFNPTSRSENTTVGCRYASCKNMSCYHLGFFYIIYASYINHLNHVEKLSHAEGEHVMICRLHLLHVSLHSQLHFSSLFQVNLSCPWIISWLLIKWKTPYLFNFLEQTLCFQHFYRPFFGRKCK